MTAEVNGTSTQVILNDARLGDVGYDVNAGALHNPTIEKQAEETANNFGGKSSVRTIFSVFWCDTNEERDAEFERIISVWPSAKYVIYGAVETSEENKKNHCHLVIAFASSKMWKTILKVCPSQKYHHKKCVYFNDAREYCWKSDPKNVREYGKPLKQGARTDIQQLLENGNYQPREIRELDPALYARYRSGILDVCADKQHDREVLEWLNVEEDENGDIVEKPYVPPEVHWYCGPTGCGKSLDVRKTVIKELKKRNVEKKNVTIIHKIENGFAVGTISQTTEVLILDEFRGSSMKYSDLLALIDGSSLNTKYGKTWIKAKTIFITSCYTPEQCYDKLNAKDSIGQLLRRITHIHNFDDEDDVAKGYLTV